VDRLSNALALTLFGVGLIVCGVAIMVFAVVWLRRERVRERAEAVQPPLRAPGLRPEIRRSALLAETVPLPPVPVPGLIPAVSRADPLSLAAIASGPVATSAPARSARPATPSNPGAWPATASPTNPGAGAGRPVGPGSVPNAGQNAGVRRGPWPPAPARHPLADPARRPH
jgi:hypothetical protein